jgi:hypothetical protein
MKIYVEKNNEITGPYTESEVTSRIESGEFTLNDLAWRDGYAGKVPLSKIITMPGGFVPPPKLAINPPTDLMQIASKKKVLTWLTVSWLVFGFGPIPTWLYSLDVVCLLIVHVAMVIVSLHLARLLQKNVVLWIGLTVVPLVNLVAIANLIRKASLALKNNGGSAGFVGAR